MKTSRDWRKNCQWVNHRAGYAILAKWSLRVDFHTCLKQAEKFGRIFDYSATNSIFGIRAVGECTIRCNTSINSQVRDTFTQGTG